jgi:NADH-quinone oxidoreductase subunit I
MTNTVVVQRRKSFLQGLYILDVAKGLAITMKNMLFAKKVTIQYPEEKRDYSERFRGLHYIKGVQGVENCTACMLCPTVCPALCISIEAGERENKEKYPKKFDIDLLRCIFCGMCEEACPEDAIKLSNIYEMATPHRKILHKDYLDIQRGKDKSGTTSKLKGKGALPPRPDYFPPPPRFEVDKMLQKKGDETGAV